MVGRGESSFGVRLGPGGARPFASPSFSKRAEARVSVRVALFGQAPRLETDRGALREGWERGVEDLESHSFDAGEGLFVPAARAPWFMALFGRAALLTAVLIRVDPGANSRRERTNLPRLRA